jgi:CDP-diacylglycerol---serine O-phosphatidyltransferase
MNRIKLNFPNIITCLNLFSGCISALSAFEGNLKTASFFIVIAAVFDFFDGFAARILKVHSEIGKELDSLADIISFGFAPSVILFKLFQESLLIENIPIFSNYYFSILFLLSSFLITIFSALRLAKFNTDIRQASSFLGLPTPANAILIASVPFIISREINNSLNNFILNKWTLLIFIFLMCFLLVSDIPMFSIKFKDMKFKNNKIQYILLLSSIVLIIFFKFVAIPFIILLYIILSVLNNLFKNKKNEI